MLLVVGVRGNGRELQWLLLYHICNVLAVMNLTIQSSSHPTNQSIQQYYSAVASHLYPRSRPPVSTTPPSPLPPSLQHRIIVEPVPNSTPDIMSGMVFMLMSFECELGGKNK